MRGYFFRRSTDRKQRVNNNQNVETDRPNSRGVQGKYTKYKYVSFH